MEKSKKFRMPSGIRNKLMAAIAMLLVSSIMMVSSTYAWFTLSTAPEVTGITTSVGANGNLEMALLTDETFADLTQISSAVNDSIAYTNDVVESNVTWGNLVDLSDISYGLNLIALNPAAPNYAVTGEGASATTNTSQINLENLLQTAVYGSDGRVSELDANTISGVYDSATGKWIMSRTYTISGVENVLPTHGVRAIGVDSNMTTAQRVLTTAKSAFNSNKNTAANAVAGAVADNSTVFVTLATGTVTTYGDEEIAALKAVTLGVQDSLKTIVKAYSNAIVAAAATVEGVEDEELTNLSTLLTTNSNASVLASAIDDLGVTGNDAVDAIANRVDALVTAQSDVAAILALFTTDGEGNVTTITQDSEGQPVTVDVKDDIVEPLIGGSSTVAAFDKAGDPVDVSGLDIGSLGSLGAIYVGGGLLAVVAADAGPYFMTESFGVDIYGAVVETTEEDGETVKTVVPTGALATVAAGVAQMEAADGSNAEQTIADFYGYILDFAFRTNASGSSLQLQTSAVNRVYSDAQGDNLATQGSGSTATFAFDSDVLKEEQVKTLLGAVRLVFLNPKTGEVHKTASLTGIEINGDEATAAVKLTDQEGDVGTIVGLNQNTATPVSVMVYLDGNVVDNSAVANAVSSGMLNLNLQFSSSANLIPMANSALKNMAIEYEVLENDEYQAGLYTFNGTLCTVNEGYEIYKGSNSMVYFSDDATTYTRLSVMNYTEALTPVTVKVATSAALVEGGTATLTVSHATATVANAAWTSGDTNIVTVADDDAADTVVTLNALDEGTVTLTGTVDLTFGTYIVDDVKVEHEVTVAAAAVEEPEEGDGEGSAYTVTFNANYGDPAETQTILVDDIADAPAFTRVDYTLSGWATTAGATAAETITLSEGLTVYAVWTANNG